MESVVGVSGSPNPTRRGVRCGPVRHVVRSIRCNWEDVRTRDIRSGVPSMQHIRRILKWNGTRHIIAALAVPQSTEELG